MRCAFASLQHADGEPHTRSKTTEEGDFGLRDLDRTFIATNIEEIGKRNPNNPLRSLTRYEFLEMLVRTAILKWPELAPSDALQRLFDTHLHEVMETARSAKRLASEIMYTREVSAASHCHTRCTFAQ